MSDNENWIGILEKIEVSKELTVKEQIDFLINKGYKISYDDESIYFEKSDCFFLKDEWYKFVKKEKYNDDYICEAKKINESQIKFRLRFYNGGTCFDEMLEEAFDEMIEE